MRPTDSLVLLQRPVELGRMLGKWSFEANSLSLQLRHKVHCIGDTLFRRSYEGSAMDQYRSRYDLQPFQFAACRPASE